MSLSFTIAIAVAVCFATAAASFCRPNGVFKRSVVAAICAAMLPFVVAFAAAPVLGDGAGLGVAFILYALSAIILLAAASAALGASARYIWVVFTDREKR